MKRMILVLFLIIILSGILYSGSWGVRAGLGQFGSSDSVFKNVYANAYMADVRFHLNDLFFATGGAKYYNIHSVSVPLAMLEPTGSTITIGAFKQRVDAFEAFGGAGVGYLLGKGNSGAYLYACGSVGLITPVVTQRMEYYMGSDTTGSMARVQNERKWAVMFAPYAGVEARFGGIGVFLQAEYTLGNTVKYDDAKVENTVVFPGGEFSTSGWAIFVGVVIE